MYKSKREIYFRNMSAESISVQERGFWDDIGDVDRIWIEAEAYG